MNPTISNDLIAKQASLTPQQATAQAGISVNTTQADPNFKPSSSTVPNVNDASAIANNKGSVSIPTIPPPTTAAGLSGTAGALVEQGKPQKEQEQKATDAQAKVGSSESDLKSLMDKVLGIQTGQAQAEKDAGLDVKAQKVTDSTNKIEASQRAQTNELRALEGSGLGEVQIAQQAKEINRRYAFEQADLGLIQSAANRDYETASNILTRKTQLALEPLKTALDYTKFFYEQNKETLSKSEDRAFQLKVNQLDQQYKTASENKKDIANIQLEALKNGVQIPANVLSELNDAKDASEATSILARNGITLENKLDSALKNANIANVRANTAKTMSESNVSLKPASAQQITDAGYATRMAEANQVINENSDVFKTMNYLKFKAVASNSPTANAFLTPSEQQAGQAMKNFITAKLRKESGAAISQSEFDDARSVYFPQYGDSSEVIKQKENTRNSVIQNQAQLAGPAYKTPPPQALTANGKTYVLSSDGKYYPQ